MKKWKVLSAVLFFALLLLVASFAPGPATARALLRAAALFALLAFCLLHVRSLPTPSAAAASAAPAACATPHVIR